LVRNNPNRQKLEADTLGIDHSNKNDVWGIQSHCELS
jgi:hypothetical protein